MTKPLDNKTLNSDKPKKSLKGSFALHLWGGEDVSIPDMRKRLVYCGCSALLGFVLLAFARYTSWFGEWYATYIFPVFPDVAGRIMSLFPFSVFEILICAILIWVLAYIVYMLALLIIPRWRIGLKKAFVVGACWLLTFLCTIFVVSAFTATVNYSRETFANLTGREIIPVSKESLLELCELLINDISELTEEAEENGAALFDDKDLNMSAEAREAMRRLGRIETPLLAGYYPRPKPMIFSRVMSEFGLSGIYSPFTIEANYNKDMPSYLIPFTMSHELAHLKGFMREDEANFIAYLACRNSPVPEFKYSGAMYALSHALSAYRRVASSEEYMELILIIPEQAVQDIIKNNEFWRRHRSWRTEAATMANDLYLKANAQEGVVSYGRMIDLLVAEYRLGVI